MIETSPLSCHVGTSMMFSDGESWQRCVGAAHTSKRMLSSLLNRPIIDCVR